TPATYLEPEPRPQQPRPLRPGAQRHRDQPRFRQPACAALRRGIHFVSRDATFEAPGQAAGEPEMCALAGIPRGRETLSRAGPCSEVLEDHMKAEEESASR